MIELTGFVNKKIVRNELGLTLPFALILTFIFSSLVAVSYLFVSVNLNQMKSSLYTMQALGLAEGINERIKARLNTKTKIQPSPEQEEKLKSYGEEEELIDNEEDTDEEVEGLAQDEEFNEDTEDFDEYYADEILKFTRFITFREPSEEKESLEQEEGDSNLRPEANVEKIGSIDIPRGIVLNKGTKIVIFKDEKINLKLQDIVQDQTKGFRPKLPAPQIKALTPNYSEVNKRTSFIVLGENLQKGTPRFSNKDILIEDLKAGPLVEFLIGMDVTSGLTRFYFDSAQAEFYIIPTYDGSPKPVLNEIKINDGSQLIEAKAGQKSLVVMIYGNDLYLKKEGSVVIPDVAGIIPKVKDKSLGGNEITITLDIGKKVEPGVHSLVVATEGGLSNSWLFNVLPPDKEEEDLGTNVATVTSALTLQDVRVIENLLPLIDEKESQENQENKKEKKEDKKTEEKETTLNEDIDKDIPEEEISEEKKLSPFANVDLETIWLLETTAMVGKITKTVSEVVHRQVPNVHGGLLANSALSFGGGSYQILGQSVAMTRLTEPTYLSNTILKVQGPPEEPEEKIEVKDLQAGRGKEQENLLKSPSELGFTPGSLITVYKEGDRISDLDYAVISTVGRDTIDLVPPGLMDFHYEGDLVFQFIPPIISNVKVAGEEAEKHAVPKDFTLQIPNIAKFRSIFRSNLDQFAELADLYTNDTTVPKDEYDLPLGYMGLVYIDGTPNFNQGNTLSGKGILIIDTRSDNSGKPYGDVEITGDSKNPVNFTGIIYVHGNLKIDGNVNIDGVVIVDNESRGQAQISNNAIGMITYSNRAIKQTLLSVPFSTKPGTVMISNKPLDLKDYVQSSTEVAQKPPDLPPETGQSLTGRTSEEALVEVEKRPSVETIQIKPGSGKSVEEELIELF